MSLAPGSRIGAYEVLGPLGAGAMGEVWRARDTRLSRDVALKVLPESLSNDPDRLARFEREAQVLASLNHPNIAAIYGVEETSGATALVLELVEGPTLDERIAQGRLPLDEAVAIARQIAEALEFAHERGVVHRDLKPANVKLSPDGRVKVLDFGLAKAMATDAATRSDSAISPTVTSLGTIAGVVLGTAAYMAPEQARGANVDRRADIWSFGAVFFEMLTGKRLFDGETVSDTLASVLRAPIEWTDLPPATPRGIRRLLERCLERDSRKRLRDIGEARIILELPTSEPEIAAPAQASAPRRSMFASVAWAVAAIVVALAAVATAGFWHGAAPIAPVTRFQIACDSKLAGMAWPRISPDGRTIAFQGRDTAGRTSIWVRPLDAFAAYPLANTEGASRLFWSPDSRYVTFMVARGQLKKVPIAGGSAQLIGEVDGGADGTWGSAGDILLDGRAIDPIRKISASGGVPVQITHPDAAKGESGHAWPFFLPDGKHFIFLSMARRAGDKASIHVASTDKPGSTPVTVSDSRAEYANGYLFYVFQGTLVAHRFDENKLVVTGEPIPLVEHVSVDINNTAPFSVSTNGVLTFLPGESTQASQLVWLDRSGHELSKVGELGPYFDLALSPDGTRLAYGFAEKSGAQDIWVRDLKRDIASRLTFDPRNDIFPVWSPDGRRIAFASDRGGHFALMSRDANGAGSESSMFALDDGEVYASNWAPDNRRIAITVIPASRRPDIKILSIAGTPQASDYLSTDAGESGAQFSPDERFVAYTSNESGTAEVYVQTYPIGGGKWQISNGGGGQALWRADGKELFFIAPDDTIYAVPVDTRGAFEPGVPKALFKRTITRSGIVRNRWCVSPDGQRFIVNAASESGNTIPFSVVLNWPAALAQK